VWKLRLLGLESKSISWETALAMLQLPPGLQEGTAFAALTEVCDAASSTHSSSVATAESTGRRNVAVNMHKVFFEIFPTQQCSHRSKLHHSCEPAG
jgi:hypothetical protein